jgi:hypothetical protein
VDSGALVCNTVSKSCLLARLQLIVGARNKHAGNVVRRGIHGTAQGPKQRVRHQCCARAAVLQHVDIVVRGEQGVDGHRYDTRVNRTEKSDRPVVAIVHQQQYALLASNTGVQQGLGHCAYSRIEFRITERAPVINICRFLPAITVQLE